MFLPGKLQERIGELRIPGPDGHYIPFVRGEQVLYQATGRGEESVAAPSLTGRYLLGGIAIGALLLVMAGLARGQGIRRLGGRIGYSIVAAGWTLFIGTSGLLLTVLWAFTNHSIAYRNENLLQTNPLALPLVVLLPALIFGARWASRPALWLSCAVAVASVLGLILHPLPWFDQVNGEVIALALPANLALAWTAYYIRRSSLSPQAGTSSGFPGSHRSVSAGL
jgi:hypothetical protein